MLANQSRSWLNDGHWSQTDAIRMNPGLLLDNWDGSFVLNPLRGLDLAPEHTTLPSPRLRMKQTHGRAKLRNDHSHLGNIPPFNVLIMEADTLSVKASLSRVFHSLQGKQLTNVALQSLAACLTQSTLPKKE